MLKEIISKIIKKENLTMNEARDVMDYIMSGSATPAQIGGFLTAMCMKGETVDEITGFAISMRDNASRISPNAHFLVDTCGTGGDGANTFNISTAAAFVASAAGVYIAKHGNRSVSSKSGSADVLEELGVVINLPKEEVCRCIEKIGIGFMFAPSFHGAMKHAIAPRRELGVRTVFNILGPLTNPAGVEGQLLGVYNAQLTEPLAEVLKNLGVKRAMVISSEDGLDEISISAPTKVTEIIDGQIRTYTIKPEDFGFTRSDLLHIKGVSPKENAQMIISLLKGEKGAKRDIVAINAGAAIYVGNEAKTLNDGITMALKAIDDGSAYKRLNQLIEYTKAIKVS